MIKLLHVCDRCGDTATGETLATPQKWKKVKVYDDRTDKPSVEFDLCHLCTEVIIEEIKECTL